MSPGQVAELWEEERKKAVALEDKYREIMKARGVCFSYNDYILAYETEISYNYSIIIMICGVWS